MEIKSSKKYTIILSIVVILIMMIWSIINDSKVRNEGVYTIATIDKVEGARGVVKLNYTFNFKGIIYEFDHIEPVGNVYKSDNGKRYFIQILPDNPNNGSRLVVNFTIPDSIQSAPSEGWSQEWMKEHFPDCVK